MSALVEQAQLERWQGTNELKKITMIVEEGEQEAAYKLVKCLYTDCVPDLETEGDLRVILGMLMLSDQYQVKAALSLCVQKLEMLTNLAAISWTLANRVMRLPAGYLEKPGFSCLLLKIQVRHANLQSTTMFAVGLSYSASAWVTVCAMLKGGSRAFETPSLDWWLANSRHTLTSCHMGLEAALALYTSKHVTTTYGSSTCNLANRSHCGLG